MRYGFLICNNGLLTCTPQRALASIKLCSLCKPQVITPGTLYKFSKLNLLSLFLLTLSFYLSPLLSSSFPTLLPSQPHFVETTLVGIHMVTILISSSSPSSSICGVHTIGWACFLFNIYYISLIHIFH